MRMLFSAVVVLIALVPAYTSGAALDDSILSAPEFDKQRELRGVGSCRFTIESQSGFEEYRLGYGREEYATYLTQLPGIRSNTAITLTLGCASDDNGDVDSAMALNDNIIKSARIGHWSLSKRAARQREPKLVVTNVANGTTRGYVLMAIPNKIDSQGTVGFCVTDQQQVLCGGASLSAVARKGENIACESDTGDQARSFPEAWRNTILARTTCASSDFSLSNWSRANSTARMEIEQVQRASLV